MTEPVRQPDTREGEGLATEGSSGRKAEILRPAQIFDPVARALDVLGDRWTLVLVRQLMGGPKGFQELRVRTGIAPKVLSSRLRQLRSDGFVTTEEKGSRSIYRDIPFYSILLGHHTTCMGLVFSCSHPSNLSPNSSPLSLLG